VNCSTGRPANYYNIHYGVHSQIQEKEQVYGSNNDLLGHDFVGAAGAFLCDRLCLIDPWKSTSRQRTVRTFPESQHAGTSFEPSEITRTKSLTVKASSTRKLLSMGEKVQIMLSDRQGRHD